MTTHQVTVVLIRRHKSLIEKLEKIIMNICGNRNCLTFSTSHVSSLLSYLNLVISCTATSRADGGWPARQLLRCRRVPADTQSWLTYASPAWSGFITTTDRQRVDAFLSRSKRCGFCPADLPEFGELLEKRDDELFSKIINNPHHTLHQLLPPQSTASQQYHLRHRTHNRQLPAHHGHLVDCNFITRLLYKDTY